MNKFGRNFESFAGAFSHKFFIARGWGRPSGPYWPIFGICFPLRSPCRRLGKTNSNLHPTKFCSPTAGEKKFRKSAANLLFSRFLHPKTLKIESFQKVSRLPTGQAKNSNLHPTKVCSPTATWNSTG